MSTDPNKSPFPGRLKEARKAANLSQKELGLLIGLDESVASPRMNQYETGKHAPNFTVIKALATVLKRPTAYFYCEEDALAKVISEFWKAV